jgi:hypothetical protein
MKNLLFILLSLALSISLFYNYQTYTANKFEEEIEKVYYTQYSVINDNNGQIMGLMQLQTVAEPIVGDSIIIFTEDKEFYLSINSVNSFLQ